MSDIGDLYARLSGAKPVRRTITRAEFINAYAARSSLSPRFAGLGILDAGGRTLFALPCACGSENCEGWTMVSAEGVIDHLELYAPHALRDAYAAAVEAAGGK